MEKADQSALKHKILSITKRTDQGYKCQATRKCTYTQPLNKFVPSSFCRHVKTFHINVYNALLLGKVEESVRADRDQDGKQRMTMKTKIMSVLKVTDTDYKCGVTDHCTYKQPLDKFTPGNFARHIAALHTEVYKKLELGRLDVEHAKRPPKPPYTINETVSTKANKFRFMCGLVRLVTCHGLPFDCVSWQGMQDIMAPQLEAFKMPIEEDKIRAFVEQTANRMQKMICEDMRGRMVSLQLHGIMGKDGQYLVRVTCSYLKDTYVCKRTLGIIVLDETKTCEDLEDRVNKIKERCGLEQWQIYTISIDYGRIDLVQSTADEQWQQAEVDESKFIEILGQYNASLNDVTVLQCGRHLLSMVATEATQDFGETIEEIIEMVKSFRYDEYKLYFQTWQGRYPPIPDKNNYGFGTYLMMKALKDERSFFEQFTTHYPGYALYLHWDLIDEFVVAFEPLYDCAVRIGNCGLSDFHLQWLLSYGRIRCIAVNQFRDKLLQAMETRQKMLEELAPYRAALYMDPRLNFRGSKLFDHNKREKVITFLQSIYTMSEDTSDDRQQNCHTPSSSSMQTSGEFSMNALLTEMLGEGSPESAMEDLIREIQQQERCDADDVEFDIIKYWIQKKMHDSRLWTLAMVVFSPLATHCDDAEEDFSRLTGVAVSMSGPNSTLLDGSPKQDDDSMLQSECNDYEGDAWNALFVKQNPNLLERSVMEEFFQGRQPGPEPDSKSDVQG